MYGDIVFYIIFNSCDGNIELFFLEKFKFEEMSVFCKGDNVLKLFFIVNSKEKDDVFYDIDVFI